LVALDADSTAKSLSIAETTQSVASGHVPWSHGDVVGRDAVDRGVVQLVVDVPCPFSSVR
jgi:hypothetical protein